MPKDVKLSRASRAKIIGATTSLVVTPLIALSTFALTPTQALSDQDLCVTAVRVDDSKISYSTCAVAPEVSPVPTASATATASPTSSVSPAPTPTPSATYTPPVLPPGVATGEVFSKPVKIVYDLRQMAPLNDGGMITVQSDGVWLTPKLRVDPIKITGYDAVKLATPLGVEASADGQTIAIFNGQWIQVSWDGGATWLAPQEQLYYNISYRIREVSVPANGGSVITAGTNETNDPTINTRSMGVTKKTGKWVGTNLLFGYKPFMATDGVTALQPVFHQRIVKTATVETMTVPSVNSLLTVNFTAFATSGNFSTQLASMDSTDSKLSTADKAMALRISRDGGLTWKIISFGTFTNLQVSSDGQKMVSVDSSNTMRLSTDNGVTWNVIDPIGNGVKAGKVEMAPDGKSMLIMGSDGKTYQTSVTQVIP